MAKMKPDKEDVAARDAPQALSWNALIDPGQEIVEMIWLVPQDRISVCVVEQTVDASEPQIREPVTRVITHERFLKSWSKAFHKSRCRTTPWSESWTCSLHRFRRNSLK